MESVNMKKLEHFSLLSNISKELESHIGCGDKILAEFILEIGRCSETVDEFEAKLKDCEAGDIPDYLVRSLHTMIHAFRADDDGEKSSVLPALSLPNDRGGARRLRLEIEKDAELKEEEHPTQPCRTSDEPELYSVYKGKVSRVMATGCFVQLNDLRGKEGLVHVSQIAGKRIADAKDAVKRGQEVYVKIISVSGQKLSLSMRDVDQKTGKDLIPMRKSLQNEAYTANPASWNEGPTPTRRLGLSGITIVEEDEDGPSKRPLKRMSSPERWEAKQLTAGGVMDVRDYPIFDDDGDGILYQEEGAQKEIEIELNEDEPAFLRGQSRYSIDMSPVKIFKNPEGSLGRAAALQSALIKERRELREQQQRTLLDSIPKDLNRPWEDPMPETVSISLRQDTQQEVKLGAHNPEGWQQRLSQSGWLKNSVVAWVRRSVMLLGLKTVLALRL